MTYRIIALLLVFSLQNSFSQTEYLDSLYSVNKTTHTYHKFNKRDSLQLDFYSPQDIEKDLPLLLYIHGGGFSGGYHAPADRQMSNPAFLVRPG